MSACRGYFNPVPCLVGYALHGTWTAAKYVIAARR